MKHLPYWSLLFFPALALSSSASAAEPTPSPNSVILKQQTGIVSEMRSDGFSVVTLGDWPTLLRLDRAETAHRRADDQSKNVHLSSRAASNFRRAIYLPHVHAAERRYAIPRGLLDALIWTESRYNPVALSKAGAAGLGQLMPATARSLGVANRFDAQANLLASAQYLRQMIDQFGTLHLAIAAYNAGPNLIKTINRIPKNAETSDYVRSVLDNWFEINPAYSTQMRYP